MEWSLFCDAVPYHIIKPSTKKKKEGRTTAKTFCGNETSDNIDLWCNGNFRTDICGVCWRALERSKGMRISRHERKYRKKVMNLNEI